jgi:hypothetical protein
VPREQWPVASLAPPTGLARAPALPSALPGFRRSAALGDPARNLFILGVLLHSAELTTEAKPFVRAAARDGLPEALSALQGAAR